MDIKSGHSKILLSPLLKYSCVEEWLIDIGLSKSWIKKKLTKKELQKKIKKNPGFSSDLLNKNMIGPIYNGPEIEILHEDDLFLVIEKPSKVHGHALEYSDDNNILSFFRSINKGNLLAINNEKAERGLLYRLDFDTSGVLVYVKNESIFQEIFEKRNNLITTKKYLAFVHGKTMEGAHLKDFLIGSESKGSKMKVSDEGQEANLSFITKKYDSQRDLSLIEIDLRTGLRHQIRIQLAHSGHPLLGDVKYGGQKASRLFLHAQRYTIFFKQEYI